MGIWGFIAAGGLILGAISGIFFAGVTYGDLRTAAEYKEQAIAQRDAVIADQAEQIDAAAGGVEKAQADMIRVQEDLAAIRRNAASVGSQLRSALDASQMGTCLLDPPVRGMRADAAETTNAAVDAANRARDPG